MNSIGPIIDMRRELNLTSRQLVRLDSLERTLLDRNDGLRNRIRVRLDSLRPQGNLSGEEQIQWRPRGSRLTARNPELDGPERFGCTWRGDGSPHGFAARPGS
jgi:hypothetical protein